MKRLNLMIGAVLLLSGCAQMTPEQKAARAQEQVEQMIAVYGPACEKLGFSRDDDKWRDCVLRLQAQDDYRASRYTTTTCFGHRGFLDCTTM